LDRNSVVSLGGSRLKVEVKELSLYRDERGWLTEILSANKDSKRIEQVHFAVSKPGAVRGNHYHKRRTEWLCVTYGTGRILLEDAGGNEREELVVTGGSPVLVKIPPGIVHAIENCADVAMHLLVMVDEKPDTADSDTFKRVLIRQNISQK
jgi:UDP-2-acetamido-2,6-beta-L-arabino-hexul-4-ose reductase